MFSLRRQSWLAFRLVRHASVARQNAANATTATTSSALELIRQLELDSARVLRVVRKRVDERTRLLAELSEGAMSSSDIKKARQAKELEPLQTAWEEWESTKSLLLETYPLLSDPDPTMRSLAEEEYPALTNTLTSLTEKFPTLLTPPSPTRHLSAIMDFKSGAGGQESSLFLAELVRMYTRYAGTAVHDDEGNVLKKKWKVDVVAKNDADAGGIKDAILEVKGEGAYDAFRWESGVHRVQRVPATESGGRVHTSTVALIVLPLPEETDKPEADELFKMDDVKIEVMRARGAGGQHVNKTESAVRLTHIPTGITVSMQDERSQHTNKRRAFQVLRARLLDIKLTQQIASRRATRQSLVKTADRSEKIRTYNYAQDRITDHRVPGLTVKNLMTVLEGNVGGLSGGLGEVMGRVRREVEQVGVEEMLDAEEEGEGK